MAPFCFHSNACEKAIIKIGSKNTQANTRKQRQICAIAGSGPDEPPPQMSPRDLPQLLILVLGLQELFFGRFPRSMLLAKEVGIRRNDEVLGIFDAV